MNKKRNRAYWKRWLRSLLTFFVFALLVDVVLVLLGFSADPPPLDRSFAMDEKLGWKHREGYQFEREVVDKKKRKSTIRFESAKHGFRLYPEGKKDSTARLLIVGDSFTQALDVSSEQNYVNRLAEQLSGEVFAYGMAGYATLQEAMLVEAYVDRIQPDVVLIQFCSNDYLGNELQVMRDAFSPEGTRRPYLAGDGSIYYANPLPGWRYFVQRTWLISGIYDWFASFRSIESRLKVSAQARITTEGTAYPAYATSVDNTRRILQDLQAKLDPVPLAVFSADLFRPQEPDLDSVCQTLAIPFLRFPDPVMHPPGDLFQNYAGDGWHWNEFGHQIMANQVQAFLENKFPESFPASAE
ncbi:MAG: SGNH/GDSL hydrolase family protein [Bacteroidota bacterium]